MIVMQQQESCLNLFQEYQKQQSWREWLRFIEYIPFTEKDTVVDLGCSVGDVTRMLSYRVAHVVGVDSNSEFFAFCESNKGSNETFLLRDFEAVDYLEIQRSFGEINGIWASFSLSYLSDPVSYLASLYSVLEDNGWIALLDVSCFISGNLAKESKYYHRVLTFERESYLSGIYDFDFGSKMQSMLKAAGFDIVHVDNDIFDPELNFSGAASDDIIDAWSARLSRMKRLKYIIGEDYGDFCHEFLSNMSSDKHDKRNNVRFVIAHKKA